jgi:hypothetical protein
MMHTLTLVLLLLQAPGDGWALAQVPPRQVKTLFWDLFGTSETWVSVIPGHPEGGQPLVRLILQAFFLGKDVKRAPNRLVLQALPLPMTVVKEYSLRLVVDDETFDLGASCMSPGGSGPPCQLLFPVCADGCAANGVAVEVQPALLQRLAKARVVGGTALGFPILLSSDDLGAVGKFVQAIHLNIALRE